MKYLITRTCGDSIGQFYNVPEAKWQKIENQLDGKFDATLDDAQAIRDSLSSKTHGESRGFGLPVLFEIRRKLKTRNSKETNQ